MERKEVVIGQKYGRMLVIGYGTTTKNRFKKWLCRCDCGKEKEAYEYSLKNGTTLSCGCLHKERFSHARHNLTGTKIYNVWKGIKARCYNTHSDTYRNYGGRGIKMCDEWRDNPEKFIQWAYANGYKESYTRKECSLDRIDVNGDYEPTNCRWVDSTCQSYNRRDNVLLTCNGESHNLLEWEQITGIKKATIYARVHCYHWSVKKALGYTDGEATDGRTE